jgi:hypothetical protein
MTMPMSQKAWRSVGNVYDERQGQYERTLNESREVIKHQAGRVTQWTS